MSRCRNLFSPVLAMLGVAVAVFGAPANASAGFELTFASTPGSNITFNPANPGPGLTGSFQFNPQGSNTFQITGGGSGLPSGGPNSANSLFGTITGSYNIGAITGTTVQTAPVTLGSGGSHQFVIDDGKGNLFTANINWIDITTIGAAGALNASASINLSAFSYGGTNADLISLATNTTGNVTATFQFATTHTLTQLTTPGQPNDFYKSGSFSGSLTAPQGGPLPAPAPAGLVLMASGLPFLLVGRAFRRRATQESALAA